jgi:pilus assembly protein CpaE
MLTDGSAYFQLQEEIRHAFEGTVIDFPRNVMVQFPHLLTDVQVVALVVEFTLAATRDTIRVLSWLKTNAPQARVIIVANKIVSSVQEVSRKDFEQSIERRVDVVVPYDPKPAAQAAKLGQPMVKVAKSSRVAQAMNQLLKLTLEQAEEDGEEAAAPEPTSLLGKLGKFGMQSLAKKESKVALAKS